MNEYERKACTEILSWKARSPRRRLRNVVPERLREQAGEWRRHASDRLGDLPGVDQLQAAAEKLASIVVELGAATVFRQEAVWRFKRKGIALEEFGQIRSLSLQDCDRAFPQLDRYLYMGTSGAVGASAAAVTTIGEVAAFVGGVGSAPAGGVASAPGAGVVVTAVVADLVAFIAMSSRLIAEVGAAYGYDPEHPGEKLFIAGVLGAATAGSQGAKWAAYQELSTLTQKLARNATWKTLEQHQVAAVLRKVYEQLGFRLTKDRLASTVPVLGVAVQAGLNMSQMSRISDAAWYLYRERRLMEDFPEAGEFVSDTEDDGPEPEDGADVIKIVGLVDAAMSADLGANLATDELKPGGEVV